MKADARPLGQWWVHRRAIAQDIYTATTKPPRHIPAEDLCHAIEFPLYSEIIDTLKLIVVYLEVSGSNAGLLQILRDLLEKANESLAD